mmetsp:Transcript_68202/g.177055  ORF Transcript_68202/g.177055 Transcript_68202/m.177055 type:complete len:558 (-) Transcript_68202:70-1743(-)
MAAVVAAPAAAEPLRPQSQVGVLELDRPVPHLRSSFAAPVPALGPLSWLSFVAGILAALATAGAAAVVAAAEPELGLRTLVGGGRKATLATPAGWTASIWVIIFLAELTFAVGQLTPSLRAKPALHRVTPWWCVTCLCQVLWAVFTMLEYFVMASACTVAVLVCLLRLAWGPSVDGGCLEYCLLRVPFSLHAGWMAAIMVVDASTLAAAKGAGPETLMAMAIGSLAALFVIAAAFAIAAPRPEPLGCLAIAWAAAGIAAALQDDYGHYAKSKQHPFTWDPAAVGGLQDGSIGICIASLAFAILTCILPSLRQRLRGVRTQPIGHGDYSADKALPSAAGQAISGNGCDGTARRPEADQEAGGLNLSRSDCGLDGGGDGHDFPPHPNGQPRRFNVSVGLALLVVAMLVVEIVLISLDSVPWVIDKAFWLLAITIQLVMSSFWPLQSCGVSARCTSKLMDVCHWAFVVMAFSGVLVLRSSASLIVIGSVALLTIVCRLFMGNECIITAVAETSSLPPISVNAVNAIFGGLLAASVVRLLLAAEFGEGWPVLELFQKIGWA